MIRTEESIFEQAIQFENAHECATFLDQACASQPALRQKIESLLKAFSKGAFLESPAFAVNETLDMPEIQERPGSQIGRYKLLEQIGEGGMGVVYMAEQTEPVRRRVALKVVKPGMDTRQVIARFEAERQALAMMDHLNIAKVHDGGTTESGRPFFVMELVRGMPITEYCDQVKLVPRMRLELFVTVCQAVAHAHQKGIIHRDLKPSNILVTLHDGVPVPKVIDFGIAKAISAKLTEKTLFTGFGQILGTPLYMSPEQAEISGLDVDTRSDVYSLGVLLYELLTGQTPFDKDKLSKAGFDEMRRIIREDEPLRPSQRVSTVNAQALSTVSLQRGIDERRLGQLLRGELDWIVMQALEKDRNRRYESVAALAADILRYLQDEPVQACPPTMRYRFGKFVRRNRVALVTAGLVSAALALGTVLSLWQAVRAVQAQHLAVQRLQQVSAEKQRADEEQAIAVAVKEFLHQDLLGEAAPEKNARAKEVTVVEVLGRAAARIEKRFHSKPRIEAEIRQTIGNIYFELGNYPAAEPQVERAWGLFRQVLGEDHPDTLSAMSDLATLYISQGQYVKAESLALKALEDRRRVLGNEHRDTLSSLDHLGVLYWSQDQFRKAEPYFLNALEGRRHVIGEEDPDTLNSMNNLASCYQNQDQSEKAEPLYVKTLAARRRVLGEEHPNTLTTMNNLATLYQSQGRYDKAESLFVEALDVSRRIVGEEHPDCIRAMHNLAGLYAQQRQYDKSEPLLVKALEISRRVLGENHTNTLQTMRSLAQTYWSIGQLDRSISLFEETLALRVKTFGHDHPETLSAMGCLGVNYRDAGRLKEAIPLLEEACQRADKLQPCPASLLFIPSVLAETYEGTGLFAKAEPLYVKTLEDRRSALGDEHPSTLVSLNKLASMYNAQGQYKKADPLLRDGLQKTRHQQDDFALAGALASMGLNLIMQEKYSEAESLLRECLTIREQKQPDDWRTFNTTAMLGGALLGQQKYPEAEPLLLSGYEGMKQREAKIPAVGKARLTEALERLVQLYDALGKNDEAAKWRQEWEARIQTEKEYEQPKEQP